MIPLVWTGVIGFAEGLIVGSGFVALLTVLDIVPRLVHLTRTKYRVRSYERAIIIGGILASLTEGWEGRFYFSPLLIPGIGLGMGIFVGLLAGALTEVLNVLPVISRRLSAQQALRSLLLALILGKIVGSFMYWLVPSIWE